MATARRRPPSVDEEELVGVEQQPTGGGQTVLASVTGQGAAFLGRRWPTERQPVAGLDLFCRVAARLAQPLREELRLTYHERIVEQRQRLHAVSVVLRRGVLMFGSAQSRQSRNGLGTLRTVKR